MIARCRINLSDQFNLTYRRIFIEGKILNVHFSKKGTTFIANSWKIIAIGILAVAYILGIDTYTYASEAYPYATYATSKMMWGPTHANVHTCK